MRCLSGFAELLESRFTHTAASVCEKEIGLKTVFRTQAKPRARYRRLRSFIACLCPDMKNFAIRIPAPVTSAPVTPAPVTPAPITPGDQGPFV